MTPWRGNTNLFHSYQRQQLPRLRLGPLKGFLSWHAALQGPSPHLLLASVTAETKGQVCQARRGRGPRTPSRTTVANFDFVFVESTLVSNDPEIGRDCPPACPLLSITKGSFQEPTPCSEKSCPPKELRSWSSPSSWMSASCQAVSDSFYTRWKLPCTIGISWGLWRGGIRSKLRWQPTLFQQCLNIFQKPQLFEG